MNIHDFISDYKSELISGFIGATIATVVIVFIIGRKKFTWVIHELIKMYSSNEKSWLSKKRLESGIAFIIAEHGALFWLTKKYDSMTTSDFGIWAGIQLAVAGWMINAIQKEKVANGNVNINNEANG